MPIGLPDWTRLPGWAAQPIAQANPFLAMAMAPLRGAKVDLDPEFGIPLLGHFLALPSLASGLMMAGTDDPTNPALARAREAGAMTAWRERQDVPELAKVASDFVMGLPMGGPLKYVTQPLAAGASRALPGAIKAAGPLAAPFQKLLAPSSTALVNEAGEQAATVGSRLLNAVAPSFAPAAGSQLTPQAAALALQDLARGTITPEAFSEAVGVGLPTARSAQSVASRIGDTGLDRLVDLFPSTGMGPVNPRGVPDHLMRIWQEAFDKGLTGREGFFHSLDPLARSSARGDLGVRPQAGWQRAYQTANQGLKELLLSGGTTAVQNLTDVAAKAGLAGISPAQVGRDVVEAGRSGGLAEATRRLGAAGAPAELGLDTALQGTIGANPRDLLVNKIGRGRMAALGAGIGALTGNPLTALTGAGVGALTHLGANVTSKSMKAVETASRLRFLMEGGKRFLAGDADTLAEHADEVALARPHWAELRTWAGPRYDDLMDAIRSEGHLIPAERVEQLAASVGVDPAYVPAVGQSWRSLHELAQSVGTKVSNKFNFPYSRPTNLEQGLRAVTPFPTFALHNLPFYARQLALAHPGVGAGVGNYLGESEHERLQAGLPTRYFGSRPILGSPGGGQVWANPLAPLSITGQLSPPREHRPGQGGLDPIVDTLDVAGLGLNPMLSTGLQTAGLLDRGQDLPTILPWTRRLAPLGQVVGGGLPTDPEAPLRAPLGAVRSALAPESVPKLGLPEYLVRKQLAEDAFAATGRGWWDSPDYTRAMIDPADPRYRDAARRVGLVSGSSSLARAVLPFGESVVSRGELTHDRAVANLTRAGILPLSAPPGATIRADVPSAFMTSGLQDGPELTRAKYARYVELPETARRAYLALNPDLVLLLQTLNPPAGRGRNIGAADLAAPLSRGGKVGLSDLLRR